MPYSGPNDAKLPKNVQALSVAKRKQWVNVFNSSFTACKRAGRSGCDGEAMRKANGVVKEKGMGFPIQCPTCKEWTPDVEKDTTEVACAECHAPLTLEWASDDEDGKVSAKCVVAEYAPAFGDGASTFVEYESWVDAREAESDMRETTYVFSGLLRNIMDNPDLSPPARSAAIKRLADEMETRLVASASDIKADNSIIGKAKKFLRGFGADEAADPDTKRRAAFFITKDYQGNPRWLALHSNKFFDREKEVFPESAHKEYEEWVAETGRYPELWLWHLPGSKIGVADLIAYTDGFVLSSGTFTAEAINLQVPERLKEMDDDLGVSHGYVYPDDALTEEGVYKQYRTYEISPVPAEKAANVWTSMSVELKEVPMPLEPTRRKFLVAVIGEEKTAAIEEGVAGLAKELTDNGVAFKTVGKALDDADAAAEEETPGGSDAAPGDAEEEDDESDPSSDSADDTPAASDDEEEEDASAGGDTILDGVKELLAPVASKLDSIESRLTSLEGDGSPDETPKAAKTLGKKRPSSDNGNVVKSKVAQEFTNEDDDDNPDGEKSAAAFAAPYVRDLRGDS